MAGSEVYGTSTRVGRLLTAVELLGYVRGRLTETRGYLSIGQQDRLAQQLYAVGRDFIDAVTGDQDGPPVTSDASEDDQDVR